jgi:hypothetical protein
LEIIVASSFKERSVLLVFLTLFLLPLCCPSRALAVVCDDSKKSPLPAGDATTDLEVTGPCAVNGPGPYTFRNVNIYKAAGAQTGGALDFKDGTTDFYAESILVENGGSLTAGSATTPIEGTIRIHLWGKASDPGITCKSDNVNHCGVPDSDPNVWGSNTSVFNPASCNVAPILLPNGVNDCFYAYEALDPSDAVNNKGAYFGHKVLAVSYGGTLQLFGSKGATYAGSTLSTCKENDPACSGTSWVRLKGSLKPGVTTLTVDGKVDWKDQDHIVVTTTDYLPGHSEELIISGAPVVGDTTTTITFVNADTEVTGVRWPHNGKTFDLSTTNHPDIGRLKLPFSSAETRAAVALLTRNIRIISEGDTPVANSFTEAVGNYFGGHTIVRQGFENFQVQGVEFYQLGQGGAIMHYPVHYHMVRSTKNSFVKDSSVWDSMTRFITLHATQGVELARNVGFKSIGHGYYLEDATETDNQLYSNIGIFARAAVKNVQNPRQVPGILTTNDKDCAKNKNDCASGPDLFPYYSDSNHPSVFWITNGMNDFQYNVAAGAATCGACYWFVPAAISGSSQKEKWFGYASEQQGAGRAGTTPLETFIGNSCTSAMTAFQEVGNTAACNGVNFIDPANLKVPNSTLTMLPSDQAIAKFPLQAQDTYWPIVGGGGRLATRCPAADKGVTEPDCSKVKICSIEDLSGCDVTVLNAFTTSFNWAQKNFAAIWMRPFWSLIINSVVTDVQNAGVNFVTSGDFSKASVIEGFWALARKTALIGGTQWKNPGSDLSDNPLASNVGPFNPFTSGDGLTKGLKCAPEPNGGLYNASYCMSVDEGIAIQLEAFSNFQRLFSIYDGPSYQDSNAYLNILPTYITKDGTATGAALNPACKPDKVNQNPCATSGFKDTFLPGLRADQAKKLCYIPNAAIGWKQSNGFYYAPAFHSTNLFFDTVPIRHFVTEPLFEPGLFSFKTDLNDSKDEYCYWTNNLFEGFTDIDRETVLNDDDGTLTGLTSPINAPSKPKSETISVNKETFFDAPTETPECASDVAANPDSNPRCAPNTAKTSPYEYVTASIFPECALSVPDSKVLVRKCADDNWGSACSNSPPIDGGCVGIPIYRQLLTTNEKPGLAQVKRMMGQNSFQRSALTANNGVYYIDTSTSKNTQANLHRAASVNVFSAGGKYDLFFLYANKNTSQSYQLFVGKQIPDIEKFKKDNIKFGYVDITTAKYKFSQYKDGSLPAGWTSDLTDGILTLTTNMLSLANDFDFTKIDPNSKPPVTLGKEKCQPASMCQWTSKNLCECNPNSPLFDLCNQQNPSGQTVCSWSVKDLDCPGQGCPAFQVTFPDKFEALDQAVRPKPATFNFATNSGFNWNIDFNLEDPTISGAQCNYASQPPPLCKIAPPAKR